MANKVHLLDNEDNLRLEISEDNSAAYLIIKDSSKVIDANQIVELLNKAGIVSGFDEAARINRQNEAIKEFNNPILIAIGSSAAFDPMTYFVDVSREFKPDNLFWKSLENATLVSSDSPLAKINFNTANSDTDIFGSDLSDEANRINPYDLLGINVYYNDEDFTIYSTKKGYVYLDEDSKLHVTDQLKVCESLQNSSITCFGDLIIEGDVVDSYLEHDGNLQVHGNIVNCRKGGVTVNGTLSVEIADNSNIYAGQSITFSKDVRYCNCITNGYIAGSANSAFVGGLASAGTYIDVDKIGSPFHIATSMEIAIAPFQKMKIRKRLKKLEEIVPDSLDNSKQSTQLALEENEFIRLLENGIKNELTVYINAGKIIYSKTSLRVLDGSITLSTDFDGHRFAKNDPKLS